MNFSLLASSAIGLFIGMLVIMIVVMLLFGFLLFLIFRMKKPTETANVYDVKRMLARRETQITVEIVNNKDNEEKKAELVNKLRRVRSAILLVDELIEEEKAISGITDPEEKKAKRSQGGKNGQRPALKPAGEKPAQAPDGQTAEKKVAPSGQPVVKANVKPKKPLVKKKDDMEFKPSED